MKASLDNPEVVAELCSRIIGGEGIAGICRDDHMPAERSVYNRMASDEAFCMRIARARELQQDCEVERCVDMADQATPENWQVQKLKIWARQWRASKLAPKKYGDKLTTEATGNMTLTVNTGVPRKHRNEEHMLGRSVGQPQMIDCKIKQ